MSPIRFDLPPASGYLVALSGGADSMLLLSLAVRAVSLRRDAGEGDARIMAAHLHHGIRGEEADRDEAFCRAACRAMDILLITEHTDIPARARESGRSEEDEARRARYDFFRRVMWEHGLSMLLTAHHADDQLETLLHRLLRGSGTHGMAGIPPIRPLGDGLSVARPLLACTKREILASCQELGLDYVTDSTNADTAYTRNRLRHGVIPALEDVAGRDVPQRAAMRLSQAAREDDEALTAMAAARYEAARRDGGPAAAAFAAEMPAIAKRMLLIAYAETVTATPETTLSAERLASLLALCRDGREGAVSPLLPAGVRGEIRGGRLVFARAAEASLPPLPPQALPLGDTVWDAASGITVRVERAAAPLSPLSGDGVWASAVFPAELLPLPLLARPRAEGDAIRSHGMTKKLKKLICDKHIPQELRDRLPLICIKTDTPLWFPGVAFADGYPPPTEGDGLRITVLLSAAPE